MSHMFQPGDKSKILSEMAPFNFISQSCATITLSFSIGSIDMLILRRLVALHIIFSHHNDDYVKVSLVGVSVHVTQSTVYDKFNLI